MSELKEPILCYVRDNVAYFTTQRLRDQWGDGHDDKPYEHNSGIPYSPCWHNEPLARNNPKSARGINPATNQPYRAGELCVCECCQRDWNPDGTPKWRIKTVEWAGPFTEPCHGYCNSPYSVQDINALKVPWLTPVEGSDGRAIYAGIKLSEFCAAIVRAGGDVRTN
jgi:hypothetical protein